MTLLPSPYKTGTEKEANSNDIASRKRYYLLAEVSILIVEHNRETMEGIKKKDNDCPLKKAADMQLMDQEAKAMPTDFYNRLSDAQK